MSQPNRYSSQYTSSFCCSESDYSQQSFLATQLLFTESQAKAEDKLRDARQDEELRKKEQFDREEKERKEREKEAERERIKQEEEDRRRKQEAEDDALLLKALDEYEKKRRDRHA